MSPKSPPIMKVDTTRCAAAGSNDSAAVIAFIVSSDSSARNGRGRGCSSVVMVRAERVAARSGLEEDAALELESISHTGGHHLSYRNM